MECLRIAPGLARINSLDPIFIARPQMFLILSPAIRLRSDFGLHVMFP